MPTTTIKIDNSPLPTGISLSRGQYVNLTFDYEIAYKDEDPEVKNLRGFIVQPSGQVVRELTALDIQNLEANPNVQSWMHERIHILETDDRGP